MQLLVLVAAMLLVVALVVPSAAQSYEFHRMDEPYAYNSDPNVELMSDKPKVRL